MTSEGTHRHEWKWVPWNLLLGLGYGSHIEACLLPNPDPAQAAKGIICGKWRQR